MRSNKSTAECPAVYHVSFFDPTGTNSLEICPSYQDLIKEINPANAAHFANELEAIDCYGNPKC
jgi:hypothetical protein